jgi:uncharacterized protein (TIGR02678 family)
VNRDTVERQRAFTGLLARPVLHRDRDPELFALVRHPQHRPVLIDWFAGRLGYRLVVTAAAARLFRLPIDGCVIAPTRTAPAPRRVLVLAILAAAAAEDTDELTTTQDLSDRVRALSRHDEVDLAPYDPDRFTERHLFVAAVRLLVDAGPFRPISRDTEDQREGWAHRRNAIGGAYRVDRELLLRMVDPGSLAAALGDAASRGPRPEDATRWSVMRRLVELPVCLLDDLTEVERAYLTGQRHRIVGWCVEMTGWVVEQRREGLALIAVEEDDTDLPFPRLKAVDFTALMVLEELRTGLGEDRLVTDVDVDAAAHEVRVRYPKAMTKELETDLAVRERALDLLRALDLVRSAGPARWWVSPVADRYRGPRVVSVTSRIETGEGR